MTPRIAVALLLVCSVRAISQPVNVQISRPGGDPEEVSIAVNPADPDNIIAGANLRYSYYSTDGGATWQQSQLPTGTWGDPCLIFDADGRAFYAHLTYGWDAITVRKSTDGGKTWPTSVKLFGPSSDSARAGSLENSSLQDKEWLIADMTTGPHRGNIYATWTDFTKYGSVESKDSSVIVFARSTDHGDTFERWVRVSDKAGDAIDSDNTMEGAVPAVGLNGEVYVAWAGPNGLYFDRSFDAGATWGTDKVISDFPGGWDFPVGGLYRANGLPITLADISPTSPHRGTVYVNWADHRNGDADVFIMKSTDRGSTWSAPIRVNDDTIGNGRPQFFTWAAVDPVSGELVVVFYDRREHDDDSTDVYMARSTDGGATFRNEKISALPFLPSERVFMGDYNCVSVYNGRIRPIWTRMTNNALSVHTAMIDASTSGASNAADGPRYTLESFPNPIRRHAPDAAVRFSVAARCHVLLTLHDVSGRRLATVADAWYAAGEYRLPLPVTPLAPGGYYCRLTTDHPSTGNPVVRMQKFTIVK
jgi:hypothetical protein